MIGRNRIVKVMKNPQALPLTGVRERWHRRLVLPALFAGAFVIALSPVSDGDIFWHLAAGREMVRRHDWLRTDPFTLSAAGRPWLDIHWLFQLAVFAIYRVVGLTGLVVAKGITVACGAVILARTVEKSERRDSRLNLSLCAVALLAALFLARHLLLARPVILTLLMLALFVAVLEGCRNGSTRRLIWLPVLQIVWSNCQGLAVLGPILIAIYLVAALLSPLASGESWPFEDEHSLPRRALGITLAFCCLGLLATPFGWKAIALPGGLLLRLVPGQGNVFSTQIAENIPPWLLERTAPAETAHLGWVLGALALCIALSRERLALSRLLVLIGFASLALMANRNVLLFYWLASPIAAMAMASRLREVVARLATIGVPERWWRWLAPGLAALVMFGQIALAIVAQRGEGEIGVPAAFHFPVESARYLRGIAASGPIFAPDHHGGYLELTVPELRPFIDTRLVLHTAEEYEAYLDVVANPEKFDVLAETQKFRYVVLTTAYPDRYIGLAQHLATNGAWHLVFTDGSEVVFAREGASMGLGDRATTDAILATLATRFSNSEKLLDTSLLNFARLLIVLGETREAQIVLSASASRAAAQMRARAWFVAGERRAAESLARTLLDSDGDDVRSLALLAQIAIAEGHGGAGAEWLSRALRIDPYDPEARAVLARLENQDGFIIP